MPKLLSQTDIWKCKLSIRRINEAHHKGFGVPGGWRRKKRRWKRDLPEYPASLGDFTLAEFHEIILYFVANPYKDCHIFHFLHGQYIVDVQTNTTSQKD